MSDRHFLNMYSKFYRPLFESKYAFVKLSYGLCRSSMKYIRLIVQIKLLSDKKQMSVQHKKNFAKLDSQAHILVKKSLAAVVRRFLETRKVQLRDRKVLFLFIRILFFSKNASYFVIDPVAN